MVTSLLVFGLPAIPPCGEVGRDSGRVGLFCGENSTISQSALPSPGLKARLSQRESNIPQSVSRSLFIAKNASLERVLDLLYNGLSRPSNEANHGVSTALEGQGFLIFENCYSGLVHRASPRSGIRPGIHAGSASANRCAARLKPCNEKLVNETHSTCCTASKPKPHG